MKMILTVRLCWCRALSHDDQLVSMLSRTQVLMTIGSCAYTSAMHI